jgi:hypothetical protein
MTGAPAVLTNGAGSTSAREITVTQRPPTEPSAAQDATTSSATRPPNEAFADALHGAIDRAVAPLLARHADRLRCGRGCASCCRDDITVFRVEADTIEAHYSELLESGIPHPEGACAFLGTEQECRIYAHRPYVCRTQGLPLRWVERGRGPLRVAKERRDICPLNELPEAPITALSAEECFTLGPVEQKLSALQEALHPGETPRVALRALFRGKR